MAKKAKPELEEVFAKLTEKQAAHLNALACGEVQWWDGRVMAALSRRGLVVRDGGSDSWNNGWNISRETASRWLDWAVKTRWHSRNWKITHE